jgi:hypothetical protein
MDAVKLKRPLTIGGIKFGKGDPVPVSLIGVPAAEDWVKRGIAEEAGPVVAKRAEATVAERQAEGHS